MREGRGTLTELTALWRKLDPGRRFLLVEDAYEYVQDYEKDPTPMEMPSPEKARAIRSGEYDKALDRAIAEALVSEGLLDPEHLNRSHFI